MTAEQLMDRQVRHRLAVLRHAEEVAGNVALTCRYHGITRQTFFIWKRRYDEDGPEGLRPRSRRPKVSRTPPGCRAETSETAWDTRSGPADTRRRRQFQ